MAGLVGGDSDSSALTQESGDEGAPTPRGSMLTDGGTDYAENDWVAHDSSPGQCNRMYLYCKTKCKHWQSRPLPRQPVQRFRSLGEKVPQGERELPLPLRPRLLLLEAQLDFLRKRNDDPVSWQGLPFETQSLGT
jgi:hypothetical protein